MSTAEKADVDAFRAAVVRLANADAECGRAFAVLCQASMAATAAENNPHRFPRGERARRWAAHLEADVANDNAEAEWRSALSDLFAMVGRKPAE